jgi:hypothetical protein
MEMQYFMEGGKIKGINTAGQALHPLPAAASVANSNRRFSNQRFGGVLYSIDLSLSDKELANSLSDKQL